MCKCMFTDLFIVEHEHVCVHDQSYTFSYTRVDVHEHEDAHIHAQFAHTCNHVHENVHVPVDVSVQVFGHFHVLVCAYVFLAIFMYWFVHMFLLVIFMNWFVHMFMFIYIFVFRSKAKKLMQNDTKM